jgi:RimJ/RimL family protein N-acetyltransferase
MLILARNIRDLSFSRLMEVYIEGNLENAEEFHPDLTEGQKLMQAEQDFYQYLNEVFFRTSDAVYAIWEEQGTYVSALRLEPYREGRLLEALETAPPSRRQGYAEKLIRAVQDQFPNQRIYSHVSKKNAASLRVHEKCGFRRISEYAAYIDGSVNQRACTLCWEN